MNIDCDISDGDCMTPGGIGGDAERVDRGTVQVEAIAGSDAELHQVFFGDGVDEADADVGPDGPIGELARIGEVNVIVELGLYFTSDAPLESAPFEIVFGGLRLAVGEIGGGTKGGLTMSHDRA